MFLKQLKLTNFRNYSALDLNFDDRPTILVGNNAVGKSNLLEGIYFLSTTKSARVELDSELIKQGESVSRVEGIVGEYLQATVLLRGVEQADRQGFHLGGGSKVGGANVNHLEGELGRTAREVESGGEVLEIAMQLLDGNLSKRVKVNGVPRRVVDFLGNLPAVIFYPSDINMVTGPPALRRWHLDLALSQVDQEYKKALTLYEQILTNRNKVLKRIKEGEGRVDELTFWSQELIKQGKVISDKRKEFLEYINSLETPLGKFQFKYEQSELTEERLNQYGGKEIAAAATLVGPHRDNFRIVILGRSEATTPESNIRKDSGQSQNDRVRLGRNLAHFGSRGEQRTATLAFKLAQLEYMAKKLGQRPVLLLDDVFSELDSEHRAHVVEVVGRQQTLIATVELENIPKQFLDSARILTVEDGKIEE